MKNLFRAGGIVASIVLAVMATAFLAAGVTREIPVGGVEGQVVLGDGESPFAGGAILLTPAGDEAPEALKTRMLRTDANGRFRGRNLPAGEYDVQVLAKAHELAPQRITIEEGESLEIFLPLQPLAPYLNVFISQRVFRPSDDPAIQVHGFIKERELDVRLYKVPAEAVLRERDFYAVFSPIARAETPEAIARNPNVEQIKALSWNVTETDGEGTFRTAFELPKLPNGLYYVRIQAGTATRGAMFMVTDLAMVLKRESTKVYAFVANLQTGEPVAGADVSLTNSATLRLLGRTGQDGTLAATLPAANQDGINTAVIARRGDSFAIATFFDYRRGDQATKIYLYTDRPIYRPGDQVGFKGWVRRRGSEGYSLPGPQTGRFVVRDLTDQKLTEGTVTLSSNGTLFGGFQLPAGIAESVYLSVTLNGVTEGLFVQVSSYRKPQFDIEVTPLKPSYLRGDVVEMKVKCTYFFGGPVPGAPFQGTIARADLWTWTDPETGEEFGGEEGYGEQVYQFEGVTDDNGEAIIRFNSREIRWSDRGEGDALLITSVAVNEGTDQFFSGEGRVRLLRGNLDVRVESDRYVSDPNTVVTFRATVLSSEGKPLANKVVTFDYGYEFWDRGGATFQKDGQVIATSDSNGVATVNLTPDQLGTFTVRARSIDTRGFPVSSTTWTYVWREGDPIPPGPEADLVTLLDKKGYDVGETATLLIRSSQRGGSAWVTVEANGILSSKVVSLAQGVASVSVPVTSKMKPNVTVSVSRIHRRRYTESRRALRVTLDQERLQIEVSSDKSDYAPGDEVRYTVRTRDDQGRPVPAEVSLTVVDESVYAVVEDYTNPLQAFYPMRHSEVSTYNSFPELFLDGGDKGDPKGDLRRDFKDTAAWIPSIQTDAAGSATVNIRLPDNLTKWRATAKGITSGTAVGKASHSVIARKDLMVRLATPLTLTAGDQLTVAAAVNNGTDRPMTLEVSLESAAFVVDGSKSQRLTLAPGGATTVKWAGTVGQAQLANFTVRARSTDGARDGMEASVPVRIFGRTQTDFALKELVGGLATIEIERLPNSDFGEIEIRVAANLSDSVLGSLEDLIEYPYGCVEQTMSRFVPAVLVRREMGSRFPPDLSEKVEAVIPMAIAQLRALQQPFGGFGWWANGDPSPYMTSIALNGFADVKDAGLNLPRPMVSNAAAWAHRYLAQPPPSEEDSNERFHLALALLRHQASAPAKQTVLSQPLTWQSVEGRVVRDHALESAALARTVLTGLESGDPELRELATTHLDELLRRAERHGDALLWTDSWGSRSQALALLALQRARPGTPEVASARNGLLLQRRGSSWTNTYDTSLAVQALAAEGLQVPGVAQFTLRAAAGSVVLGSVGVDTTERGIARLRIPIGSLKFGKNEVLLESSDPDANPVVMVRTVQTPSSRSLTARAGEGVAIRRTFHSLALERMENGTTRLVPSKDPKTRFAPGDLVQCIVEVVCPSPFSYALVEVPIPSNFRSLDAENMENWLHWYDGINILDDKVVLFARRIEGTQTFILNFRAEAEGESAALPALVTGMYSGAREATSDAVKIEVRR